MELFEDLMKDEEGHIKFARDATRSRSPRLGEEKYGLLNARSGERGPTSMERCWRAPEKHRCARRIALLPVYGGEGTNRRG